MTSRRRPGPTPRPCSPSAGRATRPRPASGSRRPGSRTSTSRPTCWARSRCRRMPDSYSPGQPSEAIIYAASHLAAWKSTPGAITWLREALKGRGEEVQGRGQGQAARRPVRSRRGAAPAAAAAVRRLAGRLPPVWPPRRGRGPARPALDGPGHQPQPAALILAHAMGLEPPTPAQMWDVLAQAMQEPKAGEPHRPTRLQVRPGPIWDELRSAPGGDRDRVRRGRRPGSGGLRPRRPGQAPERGTRRRACSTMPGP